MRIKIKFPNGHEEEVEIDLKNCNSIEDVAWEVSYELAERYCSNYLNCNEERLAHSYFTWVYPQIYTAIMELVEAKRRGVK